MDEFIYNESLNTADDTRFKSMARRFTREYTDSNNGSYVGSQLQFNLPSISTEQGFLSLKESSISFPYPITLSSDISLATMKDRILTLKCGSQGLVSGISIQIDNQTIKNIDCNFENIPLTYKIISQASQDDEQNLFDSIKFALDGTQLAYTAEKGGETNGVVLSPAPTIADTLETHPINEGLVKRLQRTAFNPASPESAKFTNIAQTIARRKDHLVNTSDSSITYHLMVTLPLSFLTYDLFEKFGLCKGLFMKMNINIHSGSTTFDIANTGKNITNLTSSTRFGMCPFQITNCEQTWNTTANSKITVSSGIASAGGVQNDYGMTAAVFNAVFYSMRPEAEAEYLSLVPKQKIRYTQIYNHEQNSVGANATFSAKVSNSSSRMRWLLIHTSLAASANGTSGVAPMNSLFTSSPTTCMRHASLTNLQVLVGGKPLYETPKSYSYQMFMEEIRGANSINGGLQLGLSSGLLNQRLWEEGYGYIFIDLSRYETDNEDLVSKPLEVRATNNTLMACDYQFFLGTEAEFTLNTASGKIEM